MSHHTRNRSRRKKEFASVEHLSAEAVAAFTDGELDDTAVHRARVHIVHCEQCRDATHDQRDASALLKGSNESENLRAPRDLVSRLVALAAAGDANEGPGAESVPVAQPEDFLDRMETMLRAFRRLHCS